MRGVTIIVAEAQSTRFAAALAIASATAALGARARVYCHDAAVPLLAGESEAIATARELGVALIACQSGLAASGLAADALAADVVTGGLVSLLADLGDDRLLAL